MNDIFEYTFVIIFILFIMQIDDTIAAIATPSGVGALGIVRLAGPEAIEIAARCFKGTDLNQVPGQSVKVGYFKQPNNNSLLDQVVVTIFRAPHSYTRQDQVEFCCHGSNYILRKVLETLIAGGARMAKPGEFTLRAFLAGALDLTQAEAVADLIAAESAVAHQAAFSQLRGGLSNKLKKIRAGLIHFAALIELELDFSEEDIVFAERNQLYQLLEEAITEIKELLNSFHSGNAIRNGIPVAIIGEPNAGKSTLLNALLQESRAIVTPIAGTTRDILEETFFIEGIEFRLIDTAGLRATTDLIEAEGIRRTYEKAAIADIILYLFDLNNTKAETAITILNDIPAHSKAHKIAIGTKKDLVLTSPIEKKTDYIAISALTGEGLPLLKEMLHTIAQTHLLGGSSSWILNSRHVEALQKTIDALTAAMRVPAGEILAFELRNALDALGQITGEITTENILGDIFSNFCIGK
jgi:tRNA modification GTPase